MTGFTNFSSGVPQQAPQSQLPLNQLPPQQPQEEKKVGLLGRIMPFLQAAGFAAAFGANPALGLLGAPLFKAAGDSQRSGDQRRQRFEESRTRIKGLLGEDTPEAQLMNSLLDVAPEKMGGLLAQKVLGTQQRSDPSDARMMQMLGIPMTPEGFAQFHKIKADARPEDPFAAILAQMNLDAKEQEIRLAEAEATREAEDRAAEKSGRQIAATKAVDSLLEVSRLGGELERVANQGGDLQKVFTEPGSFIPSNLQKAGTRFGSMVGIDAADEIIGLQDSFNLATKELAFDRMDTGLNVSNQAMFNNLTGTKPSPDTVGAANDAVTKKNLRALLLLPDLSQEDKVRVMEGIKEIEERERQRALTPATLEELLQEKATRENARRQGGG